MKNSLVFDTGALSLYFAGDKRVTDPLRDVSGGVAAGYTCELNLAELYAKTCEKLGRETALLRYNSIRQSRIVVSPPDEALTRLAGELKSAHRAQLSLVDAYTIALARHQGSVLYTTDTRIARLKIVPVKLVEL